MSKLQFLFWSVIIIAILMVIAYFYNFNGEWALEHSSWSSFGCYFGGIAGLIAFAGVLLSLDKTEKNHKEESERSHLFQLLDLHRIKFENVIINNDKGAEAFKGYVSKADEYINHYIFYEYIIDHYEKNGIQDLQNWFYNKHNDQNFVILDHIKDGLSLYTTDYEEVLKKLKEHFFQANMLDLPTFRDKYDISTICDKIFPLLPENYNYYKVFNKVGDIIYNKYGHILGHYFRNDYYVMKIILGFNSDSSQSYRRLYRAQISRYEIALSLVNAVSSLSSIKNIELLKDYDIFKDFYKQDFSIFKNKTHEKVNTIINGMLEKASEKLTNRPGV